MKLQVGAYEIESRDTSQAKFYVYFHLSDGKIEHVSNKPLDNTDHLASFVTTYNEVKPFLTGERKKTESSVRYNLEDRCYEIAKLQEVELTVNDRVHRLTYKEDADIQAVLDRKHTCWKFYISEDFKKSLDAHHVSIDTLLQFSVTAEGNPNVLHKMLVVPFKELLAKTYYILPFDCDFELDKTPISLYTIKKFDSYSYEVIDE